ncbi:protein of unknown function [Georgfuchsia toluolica]|uniref:Uncharacterized protein n=1 Tax=Georgfuchsia toluolica TaxID=424218 RepID=A0A916JA37_9PROT|nr:protein of unknown function [Georgfuchsia toluolica]
MPSFWSMVANDEWKALRSNRSPSDKLLSYLMVQYELIPVLQDANIDPQFHRNTGFAFADPFRVRLKDREDLLGVRDGLIALPSSDESYCCKTTDIARYVIEPAVEELKVER